MTIKSRLITINKNINKLYEQAAAIRAECPHTELTGEYKSDTGNWCKADDSYWIELECDECGHRWSVDNTQPEYRTTKFKKRVR